MPASGPPGQSAEIPVYILNYILVYCIILLCKQHKNSFLDSHLGGPKSHGSHRRITVKAFVDSHMNKKPSLSERCFVNILWLYRPKQDSSCLCQCKLGGGGQ